MPVSIAITRPTFTDSDSVYAPTFNGITIIAATVPDATSISDGVIRLAGDLTGGAGAPQLVATGAVAGIYGNTGENLASITVDAKGRVTNIANRALPATGVGAGTYGATALNVPQFTVSSTGRLTSAADRDIAASVRATVFEALYPVGEILITRRAGNPSTWMGFGTWVRHGAGRTLVSLDEGDAELDAIDKITGVKTHALSVAELPAHNHAPGTLATAADGDHAHPISAGNADSGGGLAADKADAAALESISTQNAGTHTHTITGATANTGGGAAHNNMQPSIVVAVWRRTA